MKTKVLLLSLCMTLAVVAASHAEVRMASIFGEGMVLQRETPVKVWGTADANEKVQISFNGQNLTAKAGKDGKWSVSLKPMKAGGPYEMTVKGKKNVVSYGNVLIGEVWLCSGQSNMEWLVSNSMNAAEEIAAADYPNIRCFTVQKAIAVEPQSEFSGQWEVCSPQTAGHFTAVGYFFARKLWQELDVPIGIINSSWGGTDVEVWTSPDSYEALPAEVRRDYDPAARDYMANMTSGETQANKIRFQTDLDNDPGLLEKWYETPGDLSAWKTMDQPRLWSQTELRSDEGHVWFRREFELPESAVGAGAFLSLGPVDDRDITWINGVQVGAIGRYDLPRRYEVGEGILKAGRNVITVRVTDTVGDGGFYGDPAEMFLLAANVSYPLSGEWLYRPSIISTTYGLYDINPNQYYSTLYNGMINPMVGYAVKGAVWYQGENNAWNAHSYRTLFPNMITDWRNKWGYDMSFYWVQLADYMAEADVPRESGWAEVREAQTMTLALPKTGQAVIIDIGDPVDIHPRNKQDVGLRLALNALHKDYGRSDVIYSGPVFASSEVNGNSIVVKFDTFGSELSVRNKYGYVEGFAVAGADRVFHWAKAWIEDGKVVVCSDAVKEPVAVRYAWSDNPRANLFNAEGLPAGPFRTDDWPGITR